MALQNENNRAQDVPMAPVRESFVPADEKRAQELDQYYNPGESSSLRLTERDTALPAHMQLIAWRLGMQRAVMSLIDRDTQYYVAECTKTMDLHNPREFEDPQDMALALHLQSPKTGSLCSETINAKGGPNGEPPYFEICDLAADPRYCNLSFVKNQMRLIYYCGVPIRTQNDIIIGTVFVLDHQRRQSLDIKHVKFLAAMADNVMVHLETRKERMNISRIMQMNKSLAEFVNTDREEASTQRCNASLGRITDSNTDTSSEEAFAERQSSTDARNIPESNSRRGSTSRSTPPSTTSDDEMPGEHDGGDHTDILSRAGVLLQQAMALESDGGGVLFLDTATRSTSRGGTSALPSRSGSQLSSARKLSLEVRSLLSRTPSQETPEEGPCLSAALLAVSVCSVSFETSHSTCSIEGAKPSDIPVKLLNKFIKKTPMGNIWHYPERRTTVNNDMDTSSSERPPKITEEDELRKLFSHLRGARQLIFIPFWNTHLSRWSVCLVYSLSLKRQFSFEVDYCFCRAFANCVKAEIDRFTVVSSDQQKAGFISSVSHELRSPLHGILASCELIHETEMTAFQGSLVDTTKSCAHTLLDTINMVLDYSKINAFTRTQPTQNMQGKPPIVHDGVEPLLSVYNNVNVAAIAEEVIEGITTGHLSRSDTSKMLYSDHHSKHRHGSGESMDLAHLPMSPIEIILDVAPPQDWTFVTQPGTYRRILMNIFGNSLKYTKQGYIKIVLSCDIIDDQRATVSLTVTDTGIGISKSYLEYKMFTAFAQENVLSPGIGLGLSLVHSLVDTLEGKIVVQSEVDRGTTVTVKIPMKRASSEPPASSFHNASDEHIQALRQINPKPRVTILGTESLTNDPPRDGEFYQMQDHALSSYLCGWYGLEAIQAWAPDTSPDIVFADEAHLSLVHHHLDEFAASRTVLVILCSNRSRTTAIEKAVNYSRLQIVPKPFGPFKLAKVLRHALDKHHPLQMHNTGLTGEHDEQSATPEREKLESPILKQKLSVAALLDKPSVRPRLRTLQQNRSTGHVKSYPFPQMIVTPASRPSTPPIPSESPQLETGEPRPRLKASGVSLARQTTKEGHNEHTRSLSDSNLNKKQTPHKPRILLADDNEVNLKLLQTYLVRHEYDGVVLSRDGLEASTLYQDALDKGQPFHVIFMDISMPVLSGFEATKAIRDMENATSTNRRDTHNSTHESLIIAITGNASANDQNKASASGLDLYMTKPVSLKDVGALMKLWQDTAASHGTEMARSKLLEACDSTK